MEEKIMHTDLTFFTNEKDSTLLQRFKVTLENNTQFFDVFEKIGKNRDSDYFPMQKVMCIADRQAPKNQKRSLSLFTKKPKTVAVPIYLKK